VGTRGLLAGIHLETGSGTPAALAELQRSFTYDTSGFLDTLTDARANTTSFDWDAQGRLTKVTNDLSEETALTYGAPNASTPTNAQPGKHLVKIEQGKVGASEGQVQRLLWDARGFLVAVQRKNDAGTFETFVSYAYDSDGNRLRELDATGELHTWTYDDLGRALTYSDHASLWNGSGNPPSALHTTAFDYDAFGNRTQVTDDKIACSP
jgi:YD repeat-containing protein